MIAEIVFSRGSLTVLMLLCIITTVMGYSRNNIYTPIDFLLGLIGGILAGAFFWAIGLLIYILWKVF